MRLSIIVILFLCLAWSSTQAQNRNTHNLFWFRLNLSDTITEKLKWEVYVQRRTQNGSDDKANVFKAPQFESYWVWLHYSLHKNVKVSLSPFGYFESYILNVKPSDEEALPIKEFRFSARLDHETKGRYFNYLNRYNLEYRWRDLLNNNNYQPNWRVRYMARLEKPIKGIFSKPVTFVLYDEIFLQFGKAVRNNPNVFDQNRLYGGFNYEIFKNVKTSVGYIYGFQERNSGKDFDHINTFWVVLNFDNLFSQFAKR